MGDTTEHHYLIGTPFALELVDSGYKGNGCGAGRFSCLLAYISQKIVKVSFHPACVLHDAEMLNPNKSERGRIQADADFEYNCIMCMQGRYTVSKFRLASWFHALVTLNTRRIYYKVD